MSRVTMRLGERLFDDIVSVEITRDLEEISGGFRVTCLDMARMANARPAWWRPSLTRGPVHPGERVVISLDGQVVLIGWLDAVEVNYAAEKLSMTLAGRDVAGDLVDCAAAPNGPAEYLNLTLTELCTRICLPFSISVTADVDVGARFPKFGIEPGETAMSAIEKACRQRAVLAVSDGVGGLRLTRGGRTSAPGPLIFGDNISTLDATFDYSERFAEYICKGQAPGSPRVVLDRNANPIVGPPAPPVMGPPAPSRRPAPNSLAGVRPRVVMTGRATDPAVTRYRPTVLMSKTQSGGASVQQQADWKMRTARAKSENIRATVSDWRAGEDRRLWRINERAMVDDPLSGASAELLIASLTWKWGKEGAQTELKLCGCDAFDELMEAGSGARATGPRRLDGTASELTREPPPRTATPPRPTGRGR